MKIFTDLTKIGIVIFVLISGLAGYALSIPAEYFMVDPLEPVVLLFGLFALSAGSFALNQAQERRIDALMPRTAGRPLPMGKLDLPTVLVFAGMLIVIGEFCLYLLSPLSAALGFATVLLYNGLYTLYWKKHWAFGAVPGAIPGAMPAVIGYSVHATELFDREMVYLFLIMFLWQMPHFWCLAIRYREDYAKGGIPTLPVAIGIPKTLYHMGLYVFVYTLMALASPLFVRVHVFYLFLVVPVAFAVVWEFMRFYRSHGEKGWLRFFLLVNMSLLIFLMVPVLDRWLYKYVVQL